MGSPGSCKQVMCVLKISVTQNLKKTLTINSGENHTKYENVYNTEPELYKAGSVKTIIPRGKYGYKQ